jgi:hypothetical protein
MTQVQSRLTRLRWERTHGGRRVPSHRSRAIRLPLELRWPGLGENRSLWFSQACWAKSASGNARCPRWFDGTTEATRRWPRLTENGPDSSRKDTPVLWRPMVLCARRARSTEGCRIMPFPWSGSKGSLVAEGVCRRGHVLDSGLTARTRWSGVLSHFTWMPDPSDAVYSWCWVRLTRGSRPRSAV